MKTLDLTVNVPKERVITLKLPEDITPGDHRLLVVIDEKSPELPQRPLSRTKGMLAGSHRITREEIADARNEMWRKFDE
jgi:hypothetical protein